MSKSKSDDEETVPGCFGRYKLTVCGHTVIVACSGPLAHRGLHRYDSGEAIEAHGVHVDAPFWWPNESAPPPQYAEWFRLREQGADTTELDVQIEAYERSNDDCGLPGCTGFSCPYCQRCTAECPNMKCVRTQNKGENMEEQTGFGEALIELRAGKRVQRQGWNGAGQFVSLQTPDEHSKMTLPYLFIHTVQGDLVPWLASQTDLLAEDWVVLD